MWALIKYLITRIALLRWLFGALGSLGILVPILALLKAIGLPLLIIMGIVAIPVLIVLLVIGLPIFLVLICGAILMAIAYAILTAGMVVLKPLLVVGIPLFIVGYGLWWLAFGRRRDTGEKPA